VRALARRRRRDERSDRQDCGDCDCLCDQHGSSFACDASTLAAGETVVDEALVAQLLERSRAETPLAQLTPREREVLGLMAEGLTDRGIAERLCVTPNTVETHVRHIIGKLDLPVSPSDNRRVHAVLAYLRAA